VLIDKEKTQIDAATERMMTWTEDLEEESVVEVEEKDEIDEEEEEEAGDEEDDDGEEVDDDDSEGFEPEND
jgi:hypothetical protein